MAAIFPKDFDRKNVVFAPICRVESGPSKIEMICCEIQYKTGPNGQLDDFVFLTRKCGTWGISKKYPYKCPDEQKIESNVIGYELAIQLTTQETLNSPTEEEQIFLSMLDELKELAFEYSTSQESIDKLEDLDRLGLTLLLKANPDTDKGKSIGNRKKLCGRDVIRNIYAAPSTYIKDNKERISPHTMWGIRIPSFRDRKNMKNPPRINCLVTGPGNKSISPYELLAVKGQPSFSEVECAIKVRSLWFGPKSIKVQLECMDINYYPSGGIKKTRKYLQPNMAPDVSKTEEESDDLNSQETFSEDADEGQNYDPQTALGGREDEESSSVKSKKEETPEPERERQPQRTRAKVGRKVNVRKTDSRET